ncbi:MAG: PaaI family thioesterase [Caldilineaceae bacterium]|jgi:acyl-coenzyme A thioesterase PaaI-like protein
MSRIHETLESRLLRWRFNFFPCYRRTGARIRYVSPDKRRVDVTLPLNWKTKGYFGVTFGGSIYAATDPVLMVMLNLLLANQAKVWDKSATITFLRPGKSELKASFTISDDAMADVVDSLREHKSFERTYEVQWHDERGRLCANVQKTLHFRRI